MKRIATQTKEYARSLEQERDARRQYFRRLKMAEKEYSALADTSFSFDYWLRTTYGVAMEYDAWSGDIVGHYKIVSDAKHILFLLKFS